MSKDSKDYREHLQKSQADGLRSPISAIEMLVDSLFHRLGQLVKTNDWQKTEESMLSSEDYKQLEKDYKLRVQDLSKFTSELAINELGFSEGEITDLRYKATILSNQLKELGSYLKLLSQSPALVVALLAFRESTFITQKGKAIEDVVQQILKRISHSELRSHLRQLFERNEWYGKSFATEQLSKTVDLVNSYFATHTSVSYQSFLRYLHQYATVFFPLDKKIFDQLFATPKVAKYKETLETIREDLKRITQEIMRVNNKVMQIQQELSPLGIRRLDSIEAILNDYQQHLQPRAIKVRELNDSAILLQNLQRELEKVPEGCLIGIGDESLRKSLVKEGYKETEVTELLVQREELLAIYHRFEPASKRLMFQINKTRKDLSDLPLPQTKADKNDYFLPEITQLPTDSYPKAFFDGNAIQPQNGSLETQDSSVNSGQKAPPTWSTVLARYVLSEQQQ